MRPPGGVFDTCSFSDHTDVQVLLLSMGFFGIFAAYTCAELLQTTINGSSGYLCLFTVYGFFIVSSFTSPYLVEVLGARRMMWMSAVAYVVLTASYLLPDSLTFLIFSCVWVGISAGTLWTAHGVYMGACADEKSQRTGKPHTECTSTTNGVFYFFLALAGCTSSFLAAAVLFVGGAQGVKILFVILTLVGAAGITLLCVLPEAGSKQYLDLSCFTVAHVDDANPLKDGDALAFARMDDASETDDGSKAEAGERAAEDRARPELAARRGASVGDTLRFLVTNPNMRFMVPIIMAAGARNCFFAGTFTRLIVSRRLGNAAVGFVGGIYGISSTASMAGWSRLSQVPHLGRATAFAIAVGIEVAWAGLFALLVFSGRIPQGGLAPLEGDEVADWKDWACVIASVATVASSGVVFMAFTRATMQAQFRHDKTCMSNAICGISFYTAIGYASQAYFSRYLDGRLDVQLSVLLLAFLAGGASLAHLHTRVCSLDPTEVEAEQVAKEVETRAQADTEGAEGACSEAQLVGVLVAEPESAGVGGLAQDEGIQEEISKKAA